LHYREVAAVTEIEGVEESKWDSYMNRSPPRSLCNDDLT
jgi:hypothetical protein